MKLHFFKMIPEVSLCLQLKKDVLGRGFISLGCSTWGTAGPLGIRTRGWGEWARAAVCDPRETSHQGPGLRAAGGVGLEWRPSLRIHITAGCADPVQPFQRERSERAWSSHRGEAEKLLQLPCRLDCWSGSKLGALSLAEWRQESPQENPQIPTV